MIFRICGAVFFLMVGLEYLGVAGIPPVVLGVFALLAGIGLLVGV